MEGQRGGRPWLGVTTTAAMLLALCAALYLWPAARTPFYTKGEAREALVVRRMVEHGDWLLPRRVSAAGLTIASKPPLFHWLGALTAEGAGRTSELAVRAPSIVLGTLTVLLVWSIARAWLASPAALMAAIALATSFEWVRAVSTARVDATLAGLTSLALLVLHRGVVQGGLSRRAAVVAALCVSGAVLTKGPVGCVLPALVLGAVLAVQGRLGQLPRFHPVLAGAVVLGLVGGWYALASVLGGEAFIGKQVLEENVFRFLGWGKMGRGHVHPFYFYPPALALGFLPWTPLLVAALVAAARRGEIRRDPRLLFPLVWLVVVLAFYSLASGKRGVYLLALYPAAALLTGWWCGERLEARAAASSGWTRVGAGILALVGVLVALQMIVVLAAALRADLLAAVAPLLHARDRAQVPIVGAIIAAHRGALLLPLAVMIAGVAVAAAALRQRRRDRLFAGTAVLATALWLLVFGVVQPDLARARSLAPFLAAVGRLAGDEPVYFDPGSFTHEAAFYAPPTLCERPTSRPAPGSQLVLVWDDAVAQLAASGHSRPEVLATSVATDPKGRRHLALVRTR